MVFEIWAMYTLAGSLFLTLLANNEHFRAGVDEISSTHKGSAINLKIQLAIGCLLIVMAWLPIVAYAIIKRNF